MVGTLLQSRRLMDDQLTKRRDELRLAIQEDLEKRLEQVEIELRQCVKDREWFNEQSQRFEADAQALKKELHRIDEEGTHGG